MSSVHQRFIYWYSRSLHCIGRRGQPGRNEWRSGAAAASKPFNQPASAERHMLRWKKGCCGAADQKPGWPQHQYFEVFISLNFHICWYVPPAVVISIPYQKIMGALILTILIWLFSLSIFDSWECEEATWRGWEGGYKDDCVCPATFKLDPPTMYATFTTASYI